MIQVGPSDLKVIADFLDTLNKLDTLQEGSIGIYMDVYKIPLVTGDMTEPADLNLLGWTIWNEGAWVFQAATEEENLDFVRIKVNEAEQEKANALNIPSGILK